MRKILRAKIHRATVTHADLHYEGSITLPPELMSLSGIVTNEAVAVWNINNGSRFETYAIEGAKNSWDISVNGAAAHLVSPGDLVIIAAFEYLNSKEVSSFEPKLIFVDQNNRPKELRKEIPGPRKLAG
ncbi:MAG: aspartate 1-decarboxylase [Bdellovibrionales bacterium]|nr:aspartate 1-decarboxylase [Bdellovibrionales bacterium]